ncbi:MAG TPA: FtsX-like permease family protein, partial [Pirellulaceae bacterium]
LGFSSWRILVSFLMESLCIALLGGALGCALGSLAHGASATSVLSAGGGGGKSVVLRLTVDSQIIATGMLLSVAMGILGGLVPAISAVRRRPLESLR